MGKQSKGLADARPSWTRLVGTLGRWEFVPPEVSARMAGLCQELRARHGALPVTHGDKRS